MYCLFTDGGARGNPGPAAAGYLLYNQGRELIESGSKYLGVATNNLAEYSALILGLELAKVHNVKQLECNLDSELVVKQMRGEYKVKNPDLKLLMAKAAAISKEIGYVTYKHIPRAQNAEADGLVNQCLDLEAV